MNCRAALEPELHRMAKANAERRGLFFQDYIDTVLRPPVHQDYHGSDVPMSNPLHEFLRNALEIVWLDWFEVGPNGFEIDVDAYEALPGWVKSLVQSAEPIGESRLKVTVISKEWAMKVAAFQVLSVSRETVTAPAD